MNRRLGRALCAAFFLLISAGAGAAALSVQSVNPSDGRWQGNEAPFDCWDRSYPGGGQAGIDGSFLAAGYGDLIDDLSSARSWNLADKAAGTGPYAGMLRGSSGSPLPPEPTVTLHIDSPSPAGSVMVRLNDGQGASGGEWSSQIDYSTDGGHVSHRAAAYGGSGLKSAAAPINLTIGNITIRLFQRDRWISVDDAGSRSARSIAVPEPGALTLLALIVLGVSLASWRIARRALLARADRAWEERSAFRSVTRRALGQSGL